MFWKDLDRRVAEHLATATKSALLVAPFIKAPVFKRLLSAVPAGVKVKAFTRWRVDEVAACVSDLEVLDLIEERHGAELYLCDELHAKLYIVDGTSSLLGSANITAAALGLSSHPNFEVLLANTMSAGTARLFVTELESRSRPATRTEADDIRSRAEALASRLTGSLVPPLDSQGEDGERTQSRWFPQFRSPDRLYSLSQDTDWLERATLKTPALHDLAAISPPLQDGKAAFEAGVRVALLESQLVKDLTGFLIEPQRFGALTNWLRNLLPDANHEERQQAGQTLIRWLIYFAPDRFQVDVPGEFSEVLSIRT